MSRTCEIRCTYLFGIRHSDLTDQGSDIDEEIEILEESSVTSRVGRVQSNSYHVDSRNSQDGIDYNKFPRFLSLDKKLRPPILLSHEWRDIGFEQSRP